LATFDRLRDYALALGLAHARYRGAKGPSDAVARLAEELSTLRGVLHADATALARRNIIDGTPLAKLRGGNGYKNLAFEVVGLVGLLREHWERIERRTALVPAELDYAARRAQQLVTALGIREQAPDAAAPVILLRRQAFTLLLRAYDQTRRAVSYVRWNEGDAERLAPSLFSGRAGRRSPAPERAAVIHGADDPP
jgi:hypothetical protein